MMKKILWDKRYGGFVWHLIFAAGFIGLSLLFLQLTEGVTWFLISSALRIVFGFAILFTACKLFELSPSEVLSNKNIKGALIAGTGFFLFFLYFLVEVASGFGKVTGLTMGLFLSRVLLQQLTTGFYEELNYRFLLLEGLKHTSNTRRLKLIYVFGNAVLFGLLHCVTGWNTYTFLTTGTIGFAFAVIFVKSGNIVLPMVLHFVYDFIIHITSFMEWQHNPFFDNICACAEVAYAVMFAVSLAMLLYTPRWKKDQKDSPGKAQGH